MSVFPRLVSKVHNIISGAFRGLSTTAGLDLDGTSLTNPAAWTVSDVLVAVQIRARVVAAVEVTARYWFGTEAGKTKVTAITRRQRRE